MPPSLFVKHHVMPMAFSIYGLIAYSLIAALFLVIQKEMSGKRAAQGLKFGLSCCAVWTVYLLEPLPHVAWSDRLSYPLADGFALLVMGLLCGLLLGENKPQSKTNFTISFSAAAIMSASFLAGRLLQYTLGNSYSLWKESPVETVGWCVLCGIVLSVVTQWLNRFIVCESGMKRALIIGGLLFGADLLLFNFFMPLVFTVDIPDLIMRSFVDIFAVVVGSLFLKAPQGKENRPAAAK